MALGRIRSDRAPFSPGDGFPFDLRYEDLLDMQTAWRETSPINRSPQIPADAYLTDSKKAELAARPWIIAVMYFR